MKWLDTTRILRNDVARPYHCDVVFFVVAKLHQSPLKSRLKIIMLDVKMQLATK